MQSRELVRNFFPRVQPVAAINNYLLPLWMVVLGVAIIGFGGCAVTQNPRSRMTQNKTTVETYMEGFRTANRPMILSCLTEDVAWVLPGAFDVRGKEEFAKHIVDEGFVDKPVITVHRLVEADEVVVAEGSVRAPKKDGSFLDLVFCDVFDMRDGKIRKLVSYLMEVK